MSSDDHGATLKVLEKALALVGKESRKVILSYIQERYGMDLKSLARYRGEFANYLEEMLGDSAEIVTARIDQVLGKSYGGGATNFNSNLMEPLCYVCNCPLAPERMCDHLMYDHTREELAQHLAVIYIDDWREEVELQCEGNSSLRQLLRN